MLNLFIYYLIVLKVMYIYNNKFIQDRKNGIVFLIDSKQGEPEEYLSE